MKRLMASSALAVALAVSANSATAADFEPEEAIRGLVISGEVETFSGFMVYGSESGDTEYDEDDTQFVSGVLGRLSLPLGDNLSVQMDGELEYSTTSLTDEKQDDLFQHSFLFGGHVSWRDPETALFGGFASFGSGDHDDDNDGADRFDFYAVGAEAQFYLDDLTFYVQGGYIDGATRASVPQIDDDSLRDAFFGRGVVRWFMNEDSRVQLEFAYVDGDIDNNENPASEMTIIEWGARYDTVIPGLPILGDSNVFVGYRGAHYEKNDPTNAADDAEFVDHIIMVGFTHRFGTQSIKETDRYGATLDLPNFGRWVSAGEPLE
ncbi:MAG: hypothetical protein AAF299_07610 [Pseudomonadota bacterium]